MKRLIGNNIRNYRNLRGITQFHLATDLGVSQSLVSDWENNKASPSIKDLFEICELFEVSIAEILEIETMLSYKAVKNENAKLAQMQENFNPLGIENINNLYTMFLELQKQQILLAEKLLKLIPPP